MISPLASGRIELVLIAEPPPIASPSPVFVTLPVGTQLLRLFDPSTPCRAGPLTFTYNGPRNRFDHQRLPPPKHFSKTWDDPDRGVYYCASTLSCCIMELFGDYRMIDRPQMMIALSKITRPLLLLDLCGNGAMRAGSVSALCAIADRSLSQAWSRYFYEEAPYLGCDGLRYHSAHNNEEAFVLYEKAKDSLQIAPDGIVAITAPALRPHLNRIALDQNLSMSI